MLNLKNLNKQPDQCKFDETFTNLSISNQKKLFLELYPPLFHSPFKAILSILINLYISIVAIASYVMIGLVKISKTIESVLLNITI